MRARQGIPILRGVRKQIGVVFAVCVAPWALVTACSRGGGGETGGIAGGADGAAGAAGASGGTIGDAGVSAEDAPTTFDGTAGPGDAAGSSDAAVPDAPRVELPPECEPPRLKLTRVAAGADQPLAVVQLSGDDRLFVAERRGRVRIFRNGAFLPEPFLDMRASVAAFQGAGMGQGERGLINFAFHPSYAQNGRFYVFYTRSVSDPHFEGVRREGDVVVAEGRRSDGDPDRAEPRLTQLIVVQHDGVDGRRGCCDDGHNGGLLAFGPDGKLYAGVGDGGGGAAQYIDRAPGLAKILRLDVDDPAVPPAGNMTGPEDYPFAWAVGVRNPWRGGFDPQTGDLYFADVGEEVWEELNVLPAGTPGGTDFGWGNPGMEGTRVVSYYPYREVDAEPYGHLPVHEYEHPLDPDSRRGGRFSRAISAAAVYRGRAIERMSGRYFFGDYATNQVWSAVVIGGRSHCVIEHTEDFAVGATPIQGLTGISPAGDGELLLFDLFGNIYRIDRAP